MFHGCPGCLGAGRGDCDFQWQQHWPLYSSLVRDSSMPRPLSSNTTQLTDAWPKVSNDPLLWIRGVFEINTYALHIQIKCIQLILYTLVCLANSPPQWGFHPAAPFMHQMPLFCWPTTTYKSMSSHRICESSWWLISLGHQNLQNCLVPLLLFCQQNHYMRRLTDHSPFLR